MGSAGAVELFFIVAVTDGIGGEAITRRIKEQLDGSDYIEQAGLTLATSYRSLAASRQIAGESREDFLGKVAARIQDLINEEISSRVVTSVE
jgi:hypothetical protein